jgi:hypothetical protein
MIFALKKWPFSYQAGIHFELHFSITSYKLSMLISGDFYLKHIIFGFGI